MVTESLRFPQRGRQRERHNSFLCFPNLKLSNISNCKAACPALILIKCHKIMVNMSQAVISNHVEEKFCKVVEHTLYSSLSIFLTL